VHGEADFIRTKRHVMCEVIDTCRSLSNQDREPSSLALRINDERRKEIGSKCSHTVWGRVPEEICLRWINQSNVRVL